MAVGLARILQDPEYHGPISASPDSGLSRAPSPAYLFNRNFQTVDGSA